MDKEISGNNYSSQMAKSVLTQFQREILSVLSENKFVSNYFYFSGGTALSEFYLKHRLSEDLDFLTNKKISFNDVRVNLEESFRKINISSLEYREELSSKIFFLKRDKREVVKTDFNYFPFPQLRKGKVFEGIKVDSLLDIAVNKLHAILTRTNVRDSVDLYFIQKKQNYKIDFLCQCLKKKFSWKIDPLFLASRLLKIREIQDFPKIIVRFSKRDLYRYFFNLAKEEKLKISD